MPRIFTDGYMRPMLAFKKPRDMTMEEWVQKYATFPCLATPKIDGIRCMTQNVGVLPPEHNCVALTRSLKLVPCRFIYLSIVKMLPPWLDGELVSGKNFQDVSSAIMSRTERLVDFKYMVFDCRINEPGLEYQQRAKTLEHSVFPRFVEKVLPAVVENFDDLMKLDADNVARGFEGTMIRPPWSKYLQKRSGALTPWLMAIKRFEDSEALVTAVEELWSNQNTAEIDMMGHKRRPTLAGGMRPKAMVGALKCFDPVNKWSFDIGTGLSHDQRALWWKQPELIVGRVVKYKFQRHGTKDKPRTPVLLGIREAADMDPPDQVGQMPLL